MNKPPNKLRVSVVRSHDRNPLLDQSGNRRWLESPKSTSFPLSKTAPSSRACSPTAIESPKAICGNSETIYDPEDLGTIAGALQILHKLAKSVVVYRRGTLTVNFQDGWRLRVEKHPQYESWEAEGDGELSDIAFMCTPHSGPPWRE